jgi:hypothetical protein
MPSAVKPGAFFLILKIMEHIPVIFNMATMPQRVRALEDTVKSILPQCDMLNIYLNNFEHKPTPAFLKHPKIVVYRSEHEAGDIGDVGKFYCCEEWTDCYAFTVDDKYIYPPDYAARLIETIEKYGRKAVVSCHGRNIKPHTKSYYKDPDAMFSLAGEVAEDTFSHELGTGCMALHTDTFKITLDLFTLTNVSDILVSMALQKSNIPILMMAHQSRWVGVSLKIDHVYAIHNFCAGKDEIQTNLINSVQWKINTCPIVKQH